MTCLLPTVHFLIPTPFRSWLSCWTPIQMFVFYVQCLEKVFIPLHPVWCESVFSPINLTTFCISYLLPWSALFFSPLCCTFIVMKKKPDLTKLTKFIWFIGTCSENPHVRVDNMCISLMCIWKIQTHTLRSCYNYKQRKHKQMMFQICNRLQSAQSLKHTDSCWATLTDSGSPVTK